MDQWSMARGAGQPQQQQQQAAHVPQQGVASQYSYSAGSYSGQQAGAPASTASAAYGQPQAYAQQGYSQQAYQQPTAASAQVGYANTATYGAPATTAQQSAQQQQVAWSQQAAAQGAQQADAQQGVYGRVSTGVASVPASGGSINVASQYGGQYGAVYVGRQGGSQQVLGASGRSAEDYQPQSAGTRGSTAYGAPQDSRATLGSGASSVVGGVPSVNASGVYGATHHTKYTEVSKYKEAPKYGDIAKYGDNAKYAGSASTADYAGKANEYGGATSPTGYSQKTTADQYAVSYNIKPADYGMAERSHYGQGQNIYGQADSRADSVRGYQDSHAVTASSIQQRQSQLLLQQQALQAQQLQASIANRGTATSPLEGATRAQGDYIGRGTAVRAGGAQDYGGNSRGMLGGNYGANRAEAELVAQYGGAGGGRSAAADPRLSAGSGAGYVSNQQASVYGGMSGGRGPGGGQIYGAHNVPAMGYGGVQLPPGRDYSAGRGTGGGGFPVQRESSYSGGRPERPSIGSSRNDDRLDPRPPFRSGGGDRRYDDANRRHSRDSMTRDSINRDSNSRDRGRSNNRMLVSGGRGSSGGGGPYDRDDRERGRDRDRDRKDDDRKRDRSPGQRASHDRKMSPSGDRDDRNRKESPRRGTSYRHASPSKEKRREYVCKIEPYSLVDLERDYASVCKRYAKLYVVPEFSKLVACWVTRDVELPINEPISFEHDAVDIEDEGESIKEAPPNISDKAFPSSASAITPSSPTSSKPALRTTVWNAKVMLMSGLSSDAYSEFFSDKSTEDKPAHIHNLLKFVALRKDRSAIMAAGGRWDEELDGGDPTDGDSALIKTAIRCTREYLQLDLSDCKKWSRIVEVHYERLGENGLPSHKEITVMFLPTISCISSGEVWQAQWKARQQAKLESDAAAKKTKVNNEDASEKISKEGESNGDKEVKEVVGVNEEESVSEVKTDNLDKLDENQDKPENDPGKVVPEKNKELLITLEEIPAPGLVLTTKRSKSFKMRSMTISLDGLLDYDEEDREECTFELSLFAEVLQELLQHKLGNVILSNLETIREESLARRNEERKRKQENEKDTDAEGSSSQRKRSKFSDKPDVEVKVEVDVKLNPEVNVDGESLKLTEKVEENGTGRVEMEDIKVESDSGDSHTAALVSVESVVKATEEEKLEDRKVEKKVVVDQELLLAYRYFDKSRVGYLKSDDLRRLLHCLGKFLTHRNVKDIVACAVSESSKSTRDDRIIYRIFTEKEVEVGMEVV
uniref:DBC1/CARP1 catalytically inactive NUDIX hydrolase domain-containing protein n=1 Tax=Physcomitrium patens TaxID=3218 RepID=A0A2K1KMY0_PHYPA|nr:uncharacterized protein LOC112281406 isoform X1 [Physcomitrium patens]PNR55140.1 hypothetical protein PHYPA_006034 [Physcomitrium patens]|eukprot:XP_024373654.1 uncharacterized protein LOC112281406 isoform X1 [Physcomitrella patens]